MRNKTMLRKAAAVVLAASLVFTAGCNRKDDNSGTTAAGTTAASTTASNSGTTAGTTSGGGQDTTTAPAVVDNWDAAYIDADDYKAYIAYDLEQLVAYIDDQLKGDQKTKVAAALAAGEDAIEAAGTVNEVRKAYNDAYNAILDAIPTAEGLYSFTSKTNAERTEILGIVENYAIKTGITGISLFEDGGYVMYDPRITLGTENYIVGYGFGTLAEGAITADFDYETNPDWKRYYHTYNASDPGTANYLNDQGSEVPDFYSYFSTGFYETFMNATKDGYDWVPCLAMEKPVAVNDTDGNGTASKWRFQVRTGAEGLKYTTGSSIPSRAAFNNREVALEDYETAFKLLLTQANQYYRGSELANQTTNAIVGAKDYYNGSADGYNAALWDKVGIKTYVEDGKSYFEVEFVQELSPFYAMYYITSSLYMPVPQDFLDLVTVQNYLGFNIDATETPADNALALGAYYLERWDQDQQVVYKKNPNYVFADTKYNVQGVHIKIFPAAKDDRMAGFNEFLAGHFDSSGIPKEMLDEYRNDPRTRTTTGSSVFKLNVNALDAATWEYMFGVDGIISQAASKDEYWDIKPALGNPHFVQALKYSIDRLTFANARGSIPSVDFLSSNYMSDPENGISYATTKAHEKAVASQKEGTDGYGYSLELARDYFRVALAELEADGSYTPGTKDNPTIIHIEAAWMYATHEEGYHNEIKNFLETAFNDDSVCGGKYKLSVDFWVGNAWSDVYYNKMMVGQFDIGFGSISGNTLNPLDYMSVISSDPEISGSFTLNWGTDTNNPNAYPLVYEGERYSFDAMLLAANSQAIITNGKSMPKLTYTQENIKKNDDGSYTGALTITATLPDKTKITPTAVACCNYERYYNGDGTYDEAEVEFTVEEKADGVRVIFTVPADIAADYATGSGTSENPTGYTGFDIYYDLSFNGTDSSTYYSIYDNFVVE